MQKRLEAPKRAASLALISRSLRAAGRYAMYERMTLRMGGLVIPFADSFGGGEEDWETTDSAASDDEGSVPFVRDLELIFVYGKPHDVDLGQLAKSLLNALFQIFGFAGPTLQRLHVAVDCADPIGLAIAQHAFAMVAALPRLSAGSLKANAVGDVEPALIEQTVLSITDSFMRVCGPSVGSLSLDWARPVRSGGGWMAPTFAQRLRSLSLRSAQWSLVGALLETNASTLRHLDMRNSPRRAWIIEPLTAVRSMTLGDLEADGVSWAGVPALQSLEILSLATTATGLDDTLPPGLHELHLHLGDVLPNLLDLGNWLGRRKWPVGLRRLRITTHAGFPPRYASPAALDQLADAARAEGVCVDVEDELGRWSMSA